MIDKTFHIGERPRIGSRLLETDAETIASATGIYIVFDSDNATVATGGCTIEVSGEIATAFFYQDLTVASGFTANNPYGYQIEVTATVGAQAVIRIYEGRFNLLD